MENQAFTNSNNTINKEIEESNMYTVLAAKEKELQADIKKVTED